jgi:hypothetical protein
MSENQRCLAVLKDFSQNRVLLLTTESEASTRLRRQPRFWDVVAIKLAIQEEVKRAIVLPDYFENGVLDLLRVLLSPAHATPPT